MIRILYACACVLIACTACADQTPESVVEHYFDKLRQDGYGAIAQFIHPDEQRKFRNQTNAQIEKMLINIDDPNADSLLADPKDGSKIRPLSDAEYMNAVMKWQELADPELLNYFKKASIKVIGSVKEDKIVHVVVRLTFNYNDLLSVFSLKEYKGTPKMLLIGEMQGIIKALGGRP